MSAIRRIVLDLVLRIEARSSFAVLQSLHDSESILIYHGRLRRLCTSKDGVQNTHQMNSLDSTTSGKL